MEIYGNDILTDTEVYLQMLNLNSVVINVEKTYTWHDNEWKGIKMFN